jgi:RNA ligase (TIGR02306 family)
LVPLDDERFSFLTDSVTKKQHRIKAKKLRGVFSMGMLIPADPNWEVGQNVQQELRIDKWEPPLKLPRGMSFGPSNQEKDPGIIPVYTDLDSLRKYKNVLEEGEEVILTEKIHGANARYVHAQDRFWAGSHRQFKKRDENNLWWKAALKYDLENKLAQYPDMAIYGEVYGQVQDLRYDTDQGEVRFAAFDLFDVKTGRYVDYPDFVKFCQQIDVPIVPVLYQGPWKDLLREQAEGKSTIASHMREGFVVRPVKERWHDRCGRVIFKLVGEGYLLRNGQ